MLTDFQKSKATYDGGKEIANRKRHLAQISTALATLHGDCSGKDCAIGKLLNAQEIATLAAASAIVAKVVKVLAKDVQEAAAIKRTWDRRVAEAMQTLKKLPLQGIGDQIALADLAGEKYMLRDLPGQCERYGTRRMMQDLMREANASLANKAASSAAHIPAWCAALLADIPDARERQAALIAKINSIAVTQQIEQASEKEPA